MSEIDFKGLAHALRYRARELVPEWLPGGKIVGKEYTCSDIHGGQGGSFRVNVDSGVWKDFATDNVSGGDLISLYAAVKGYSQIDAARALLSYVGTTVETTRQSKVKPSDERLGPPPPGVGKPVFTHFKYGEPEGVWIYRDGNGSVLFYMTRHFNKEQDKKEYIPHTWSVVSKRWVKKHWPSPRPLYGLELLAKNPKTAVLVVEGEKSADAARKFINPNTYVVVTWPSGASASMLADWTPLHGRKILLWPDADLQTYSKDKNNLAKAGQLKPENEQPGFIAMQKIAKELVDHCPEVKVLETFQCSAKDGWDAADALVEGMDWDKFKEWARPLAKVYSKPVHNYAEAPEVMPEPPAYLFEGPPMDEEPKTGNDFDPSIDGYFHKVIKREGPTWVPLYSLMAKDIKAEGLSVFSDSGDYKYKDGVWVASADDALKSYICEVNAAHIQPTQIDNFAKIIRGFNYFGSRNFKDTEGKINVKNGILDLKTYRLEPHSKEYFFKWKIPVEYNSTAACDKWLAFLDSVFVGDKTMIDASQKIFGYILMGGKPFFHKAFVLPGSGRNGKGVFLGILRTIVGRENWSNVSINMLDAPFSAVMLDGKMANISEETPNEKLSSNTFKEAVGGGYLTMAKKYVDEYSGQVLARFIFACNELPVFADNTEGCLDRLFFLPFNRYFKPEERDPYLEDKLKATELPGILNWAIEGMKILRAMDKPVIDEPVPSLLMKEKYQLESDTVYEWMEECLLICDNLGNESTRDCYESYVGHVSDSGKKPLGKNKFVTLLSKHGKRRADITGCLKFSRDRYSENNEDKRGFIGCEIIKSLDNV